MKENDWIVASINNPNFTNSDFKNILGITEDNVQMLSKDEYKNSQYIKDVFKKESSLKKACEEELIRPDYLVTEYAEIKNILLKRLNQSLL